MKEQIASIIGQEKQQKKAGEKCVLQGCLCGQVTGLLYCKKTAE